MEGMFIATEAMARETPLLRSLTLFVSGLLVIVSLIIVYPVVAYSRNVAYTEGIVSLALAFFTVTVIMITDIHLGLEVLSDGLRVVAALFALVGTYYFARDFVDVGDSDMASFGVEFDMGGDDDGDD